MRGMMGCCIVVLSLMGTVLAGFALAVDETTTTGTEYEYVTDISGLFAYSDVPTFVEYNPAANWTGFSVAGGTPTGGIDFVASQRANSYPIQQDATQIASVTLDLSGMDLPGANPPGTILTDGVDLVIVTDDAVRVTDQTSYIGWPRVATLASIISAAQIMGYDRLVIDIPDDVIAAPSSAWTPTEVRTNPGGSPAVFANYVILDYSTWADSTDSLEVYKDGTVAYKNAAGSVIYRTNVEGTTICFAQSETATGFPATTSFGSAKTLGSSITADTYRDPKTIYMDVSQGVAKSGGSSTHWSNGYFNGSTDILLRVPDGVSSGVWYGSAKLMEVGSSLQRGTIEISATWAGGSMTVKCSTTGFTTSPVTIALGSWRTCMISIDVMDGTVTISPVANFVSFQEYRVVDAAKTVSLSGLTAWQQSTGRILSIQSIDIGSKTSTSLRFGVVRTMTYLDTHESVMTDPSIDITSYFPDITDLRLRFYSFALLGSEITINGVEMQVEDGVITLPDDKKYDLQDLEVTYPSDGHVYLVLRDETMSPVDLGERTTYEISMDGRWYFTSGLYEGVSKAETSYEWDWSDFVFGDGATIVFFLGLLVLGTVIGARYAGLEPIDMLVIGGAALIGLVILS